MSLSLRTVPIVRLTPAEWLEQMWTQRFTGPVIVHFGDGVPREVQPLTAESRIVLDVPSRRHDT